MELFSHRKGLKPIKSIIQIDSMDSDLRNGLWDMLSIHFAYFMGDRSNNIAKIPYMHGFIRRLWHGYFKEPIDTIDDWWPNTLAGLRKYFFGCRWNEVYDFIEFTANYDMNHLKNKEFIIRCNSILERELSAYRFVDGNITQMTSEEEIIAVEEALSTSDSLQPVRIHLKTALDLFSDRKNPDYRNSIKESISAVEALCRIITDNPKATLGDALKEVEKKVELHGALQGAFDKLYGYTSDEGGIRHSLLTESNLNFEDAKFMLVSCSAFINYLKSKASAAGIKLQVKS